MFSSTNRISAFDNRISGQDKRRSKRKNRLFKVRISGRTYDGFDVSEHGFSIRTSRLDIHFIKDQVHKNIFITNMQGGQYLIEEARVVRFTEASTTAIWGFEIKVIKRPTPHLMLVEGKSSTPGTIEFRDIDPNSTIEFRKKQDDAKYAPLHKELIDRLNRVAMSAHSEMFTVQEFRDLCKNLTKDFL